MRMEVENKTTDAMDQLSTLYTFQGNSLQSISRPVLRTEFVLVVHPLTFQIPGCVCQDKFLM